MYYLYVKTPIVSKQPIVRAGLRMRRPHLQRLWPHLHRVQGQSRKAQNLYKFLKQAEETDFRKSADRANNDKELK